MTRSLDIKKLRDEAARLKAALRHEQERHDHMARILANESLMR